MISFVGADALRRNLIYHLSRECFLFCDLLDNYRIGDVVGLFVEFSES